MGNCVKAKQPAPTPRRYTEVEQLELIKNHQNIRQFYQLGETIGNGQFGSVCKATRTDLNNSPVFAIKSILKSKVGAKKELLERELLLQMKINHPNIVKVFEIFEDEQHLFIVMEYCAGGELFDQLAIKGRYNEREAAGILYILLSAVSYLHGMNISHRDLKPENILLTTKEENAEIKIIDFGFAKHLKAVAASQNTVVGSPYYIAPEVLAKNYGVSCDIWSLGVILYILLIGKPPFPGSNPQAVLQKVIHGIYEQEGAEWDELSPLAHDLIRKMLCTNFRVRISASEALEHPWIRERMQSESKPIEKKVLRRLRQAQSMSKFQKEAINILARILNKDDQAELNSIFLSLDRDHTGFITISELQQGLTRAGFAISDEEVEKLIEYIGKPGATKIDYTEFLSAALDRKYLVDRNNMWMVFKHFDVDNNGVITKENMMHALIKGGWIVDEEEVNAMMRSLGSEITFEAFIELFQSRQPESKQSVSS